MTVTDEIRAQARDLIEKALRDGGVDPDVAASAAADAVETGAGMLAAGGITGSSGGVTAQWDEMLHPRVPPGSGAGGQFAPASTQQAPTNQKPVGEGESGKRVSDLQKRLNELGFKLKVDGRFGAATLAAVRAFQKAKGLKVDGLVGPLTTAALRQRPHAAAEPAPGLPALVTIPDVELLAAGTWELRTGRQTFTREDLANAVDATRCPAVGAPVIKIGHADQRFTPPGGDGEPAIGRVANMRLGESGVKLYGDLAGMPGWLASITASAFPRRSIEGSYGFRCQVGHVHPFVITAVALLGVTPPGVGVLNGLPDIATLYGLTASAADRAWRTEPLQQEGTIMPVTEEDVRRAYYAAEGVPPSWWITELQMAPAQLIVSDGDGQMYRVPFRIEGSAVSFEDATPLASYEDLAASRGTGPVIVYGSADVSRHLSAADGNAGWELRDGKWVYDPDGDGDDDSSAETDTDHSHWDASGKQLRHIPPNPATGKGGSLKPAAAASVDNSAWDASKAYANGSAADDPEAFFRAICAAEKTSGDPATQDHWALPYRYTPDSPPNAAAVRAALAVLGGARGGVQGLKNPDAARAKLQKIMTGINPGYKAAAGDGPEAGAEHELLGSLGEPHTHDHPHQAYRSQGGDSQHSHPHRHAGDNQHRHDHQAAAGTNREGGADVNLTDAQITSLKLSLGLGDDVELTPDALVASVGTLRETADKKVAASAVLPSTVVAVEKSVWEATQRQVEASQRYRERKEREERDDVIAAAVKDGKFGPTRADDWRRVWDNDPDGTRRILASLPKNAVPVEDIGSPGGGDVDSELLDEEYARLFPPDAAPSQTG